jgi:hypothetical protein
MTTKHDDKTGKSLELSEGRLEVHFRRPTTWRIRAGFTKRSLIGPRREGWSYRNFLALLLAKKVTLRKQTRLQRCSRRTHFPFFRTIDEFDSVQRCIYVKSETTGGGARTRMTFALHITLQSLKPGQQISSRPQGACAL